MKQGFYNVVEIDKFGTNLHIKERSFRNLEKNEILVKVSCSPINPADIMFITGHYGEYQPEAFPVTPGLEGSGLITEVGEGVDKSLIGKRVGVLGNPNTSKSYDGLWAEYHYTTLNNLIVYDKEVQFEKICFLINPFTAIGILETLKKEKMKSAILCGAAGSLGRILIRLCQRENFDLVCLVKNEDQEQALKQCGAQNILRLCDPDFSIELKKLCSQLSINACLDCLGGEFTGLLLNLMPNCSVLYHFGNLELKEMSKISSEDLIFKEKKIKGWWFHRWMKSLTKEELEYWMGFIKLEMQSNSNLFSTKIHEIYDLEEYDIALQDYLMDKAKGKVILSTFR